MSDKYKLFGTEHPGSITPDRAERRIAQAESRSGTKRKLGAIVVAGLVAVGAGKAIGEAMPAEPRPEPVKSQPFDYVGHGVQPGFVNKSPESDQK